MYYDNSDANYADPSIQNILLNSYFENYNPIYGSCKEQHIQ